MSYNGHSRPFLKKKVVILQWRLKNYYDKRKKEKEVNLKFKKDYCKINGNFKDVLTVENLEVIFTINTRT